MLKSELKKSINTVEFQVVCLVYIAVCLYAAWLTVSCDMDSNYQFIRSADENFILMGTECSVQHKFLVMFMPILCSLTCALAKSRDDSSNRSILLVQRCGRKRYIRVRAMAVAILNFLTIVMPLLINLIICHIFYPNKGYDSEWTEPAYLIGTYSYSENHLADMLRLENPLAYNLLYILYTDCSRC